MGKILLVDDDNATNFYNKYILNKNNVNFEIIVLENGLKALNYLKDIEIPDFIFLDINMPVMGGIQFLEESYKHFDDRLDKVKIYVMMSVELSEENLHVIQKSNIEIIKSKVLDVAFIDKVLKN